MPDLKPFLLIDRETMKPAAIQVRLGSLARTHELPAEMVKASTSELTEYMEKIVPDMIEELRVEWRDKQKKLRRVT